MSQLLEALPPGQRAVALALISNNSARTYNQVAALLGLHVGTVYTHLRRIRERHPAVYEALMGERCRQLSFRHKEARERARAHTTKWFRRKRNRQYYYRFGCWPWER